MNTLRESLQQKQLKQKSTESPKSTKMNLRRWRAALIGCLMICGAAISGCQSASRPFPDSRKVTVDASLMVEPSYTKQMLSVLSE